MLKAICNFLQVSTLFFLFSRNENESLETTLEEQRQLLTTTEKTGQQEMDKLKLENNKKIEDLQNRLDSTESSKVNMMHMGRRKNLLVTIKYKIT